MNIFSSIAMHHMKQDNIVRHACSKSKEMSDALLGETLLLVCT